MHQRITITGTLYSGLSRGRYFTSIDWVKKGVKELVGFEPYPGTLNLRVTREDLDFLLAIRAEGDILIPPDPGFCKAILKRVTVGGISGALVFPAEDVWAHENTLEVLAPVFMREALGLRDNDSLDIELERHFSPKLLFLDVDGTLVDSIPYFYGISRKIFEALGLSPKIEDLREAMNMGKDPWGVFFPPGLQERERLLEKARRMDREDFAKGYKRASRPFPKVRETLLGLLGANLKLVLITTTRDRDAISHILYQGETDLKALSLPLICVEYKEDRLDGIINSIKNLSKDYKISTWDCVYVGDAVINILAARRLRMASIGVLTGVGKEQELIKAGADAIADDISFIPKIIFS